MSNKPTPDYFNIKQLYELWNFDSNQLEYAITKYYIRLWVCIKDKRNPLGDKVILLEGKANTVTAEDIMRFSKMSDNELKKIGFTISPLDEPNIFLFEKDSIRFQVDYSNNSKCLSAPNLNTNAVEVAHDGFVELCPNSIVDPTKSIANLFSEGGAVISIPTILSW